MTWDLTDMLFEQRSVRREDWAEAHVADMVGCMRATAYRRRGVEPEPYTRAELAKFAIGRGYEYAVAADLRERGHKVQHDPDFTVVTFGLTGHPDLIVDDELLVECKSGDGGSNYPKKDPRAGEPKDVQPHHAIQAAAYALTPGLGIQFAGVQQYFGYDNGERWYPINPDAYRGVIEELSAEVLAKTGPEQPLPPAEPPPRDIVPYDACAYCKFSICERNPKYEAEL